MSSSGYVPVRGVSKNSYLSRATKRTKDLFSSAKKHIRKLTRPTGYARVPVTTYGESARSISLKTARGGSGSSVRTYASEATARSRPTIPIKARVISKPVVKSWTAKPDMWNVTGSQLAAKTEARAFAGKSLGVKSMAGLFFAQQLLGQSQANRSDTKIRNEIYRRIYLGQ